MCKVFALTDATNVKLTDKLFNVLKDTMCKHDDDAFGYAAHGNKGIFGERTIATERVFKSRHILPSPLESLAFIKNEYNRFGNMTPVTGSFIAHSRLSTNDVSLDCAHPYVGENIALIHNGVVDDIAGTPIEVKTKNDTEILLRYFERDGMTGIEENVSGYYAMAILDKDGNLHIVRDAQATLYIAYIEKLNTNIIATTFEIIETVCKKMKWSHSHIEKLDDNIYVVFTKNEISEFRSINPLQNFASMNWSSVGKALGWQGGIDYSAKQDTYSDAHYSRMEMSSSDREALNAEIQSLEKGGQVDVYDYMMKKVK